MKLRRCFFVFLTLLAASFVTARCAIKSAPESLTNIGKALEAPSVGRTSSRGATRAASQGACEAANASARLKNALIGARVMTCLFGAAEDSKLITRSSSGYNYYQYAASAGSFQFRYGTHDGKLHANGCWNGKRLMELEEGDGTVTATTEWTWNAMSQDVITQTIVKVDPGFSFLSGTSSTSGYGLSSVISEVAATPNTLTETIASSKLNVSLFAAFDANEGSSFLTQSNAIESWKNASSYACVSPSTSGPFYEYAHDHVAISPSAPTSVQYLDRWDCTAPSDSPFTTVTVKDTAVQAQMDACVAGALSTVAQEDFCTGMSACP